MGQALMDIIEPSLHKEDDSSDEHEITAPSIDDSASVCPAKRPDQTQHHYFIYTRNCYSAVCTSRKNLYFDTLAAPVALVDTSVLSGTLPRRHHRMASRIIMKSAVSSIITHNLTTFTPDVVSCHQSGAITR